MKTLIFSLFLFWNVVCVTCMILTIKESTIGCVGWLCAFIWSNYFYILSEINKQ